MIAARTLALIGFLSLGACGEANMTEQDRADTWDRNEFFGRDMTMRQPVPGTVPRVDPARPVLQPATVTEAMLERGQERYDIFCAPCHGRTGNGRGMIVERGFPAATVLTSDRMRAVRAAEIERAIAEGHKTMFGMAQMIPSADRWAIVAYIRALQLSQNAEVASLPEPDRAKLEAVR
ncbi:c-type cytochrome [Methylobacterium nigriterrae]|uniref:c-type cytochrome n=1 Tax=Methylobacterium nigriterrae TaxID=3127512 RepID=UPI00301392D7